MKQLFVFVVFSFLLHQSVKAQSLEDSIETIYNDFDLMGVSL